MSEVKTGLVIPAPGQPSPSSPRELTVPETVSLAALAAQSRAMAPNGGGPMVPPVQKAAPAGYPGYPSDYPTDGADPLAKAPNMQIAKKTGAAAIGGR